MASNGTDVLPNALPPIPPNIASIAFPALIGILISWAFWGMLVVQVSIYSLLFRDKLLIQAFVYGIFIADTVQTLMQAVDAYYWFGTGFGDMTHLRNVYLSSFDVPVLGSLIALLGQTFFCYRLYVLGGGKWLPLSLFAVCFMSLFASWYNAIRSHILSASLETIQADMDPPALYVWLVSSVIGDTGIAAAMSYLLLRARGRHGQTDAILNRLVILTMETNSVSACLAILMLILYVAAPGTGYFITPAYPLGKCYANALLVTLNNRHFLTNKPQRNFGYTLNSLMESTVQSRTRVTSEFGGTPSTLEDEYRTNTGVKITTIKYTSGGEPQSFQFDRLESGDIKPKEPQLSGSG